MFFSRIPTSFHLPRMIKRNLVLVVLLRLTGQSEFRSRQSVVCVSVPAIPYCSPIPPAHCVKILESLPAASAKAEEAIVLLGAAAETRCPSADDGGATFLRHHFYEVKVLIRLYAHDATYHALIYKL